MSMVYVRPVEVWTLLGLRGQELGKVVGYALDLQNGSIASVELETPWQTLEINWMAVAFDEEADLFRMINPHGIFDEPL